MKSSYSCYADPKGSNSAERRKNVKPPLLAFKLQALYFRGGKIKANKEDDPPWAQLIETSALAADIPRTRFKSLISGRVL